ncbi:MAG: hypothetical protein WBD95_22160 [Xanthobacteraceae bacterium]
MQRNSLLLRAIFLGAILISGTGAAFAETWRTYQNDRYGTTIEYPDNFQPGNPPDANDGLAFTSPDSASFSVFASYNALDFDLAGYQDFIVKNLKPGKVIAYRVHGRDWFVISGTAGADSVFYERYLLSHGGEMTEGFVTSYPSRLKQKYDPVVARMAKSFRSGSGYQTPDKN